MKIKEYRKRRGYTQKEFAALLNVSPSTYNQWETGRREPDNDTIIMISDYLNVSIDELYGRNKNEQDAKVALFGGDTEVTDEMWEEVKQFADYVKNKNNNK